MIKTMIGSPIMRSSQKRTLKRNVTRCPMVHKPIVGGTRLVVCASPTNQRKTKTAPIMAMSAAAMSTANMLQCFRMNIFQIFSLCCDSGSDKIILSPLLNSLSTIGRDIYRFFITICTPKKKFIWRDFLVRPDPMTAVS